MTPRVAHEGLSQPAPRAPLVSPGRKAAFLLRAAHAPPGGAAHAPHRRWVHAPSAGEGSVERELERGGRRCRGRRAGCRAGAGSAGWPGSGARPGPRRRPRAAPARSRARRCGRGCPGGRRRRSRRRRPLRSSATAVSWTSQAVVAEQRADVDLGDARRRSSRRAQRRLAVAGSPAPRGALGVGEHGAEAARRERLAVGGERRRRGRGRAPRPAASGCPGGPCAISSSSSSPRLWAWRASSSPPARTRTPMPCRSRSAASARDALGDRVDLERPVAVDVGGDGDVADALGGEPARVVERGGLVVLHRRPPPAAGGGADRHMTCDFLSWADPRCPPLALLWSLSPR